MGIFDFLFGRDKSNSEELMESMPQNDAEKWTVAVYALWSEYCGGSYKYFGGYEKTSANERMLKKVLKDDWLISNKQGVIKMVDYLLDEKNNSGDQAEEAAFSYGCAGNIAARGYLCGYLTREEMLQQAARIATVIREHYHSWDEYVQQYIIGLGTGSNVSEKQEEFRKNYERLRAMPKGPYSVDWNTVIL